MSGFCVWIVWGIVGVTSTVVMAAGGEAQTALRPPAEGMWVDGHAAYATPPATSDEVLEEMSGRAAVIFAGTVTAVRMPEEENPAAEVVEVEFAVSHAVRGVAGGTYVVREWAGLWRDGARYRVGDRRLMLLHAPGAGGLSSPVDGMDGAIPLTQSGVPATETAVVGADGIAGECVDVRWLEAKTLRVDEHGVVVTPLLVAVVARLGELEARRDALR